MTDPQFPTNAGKITKTSKCKFTQEEDIKLVHLIMARKEHDWSWIASQMPNRNPRQCRERWANYLDPNLHKGAWTEEEDQIILEKKKIHGQKWSIIASYLKGRSGNDVRNRWLMIMRHNGKVHKGKANLPQPKTNTTTYVTPQPLPSIQTFHLQNQPITPQVKSIEPKKIMFAPIFTLIPDLQSYHFVYL